MAELSLYLTNANVSLEPTMQTDKGLGGVGEMTMLELGECKAGGKPVKAPRRTIHFASGETMEEYSTDEEEEEELALRVKSEVLPVDTSRMTWGPYFWFQTWRMATSTISACDYMGEKLASLFGITTPKYQYAIDEYYRIRKEEEEEDEEDRLAELAERRFTEQRLGGGAGDPATVEQPEACGTSFVNISFELDPEPSPNTAPSPLPS